MKQKVLFVFVDGIGLGSDDPMINPLVNKDRFPTLGEIMERSVPLDVSMGVQGLPQSATGQTALLTGLNAAERMGRHIEGFPPQRLKELIQEHNIFSKLLAAGKTCTFANEYWLDDVSQIPRRRESVTTVATLAALGRVRGKAELAKNGAVYHDLTREALRERGYTGPLISPEEAAEHLMALANDHDFTLFEFFQTDHVGHSGDSQKIFQCLEKLDRFFSVLLSFKGVLLFTSDHGNIEDLTVRTHTKNSVPFFFQFSKKENEKKEALFRGLEKIEQVTPAILQLLK